MQKKNVLKTLGPGFMAINTRYKVQTYLPRDVAEGLAAEMAATGEAAGSIVCRLVTESIRSKPRQD